MPPSSRAVVRAGRVGALVYALAAVTLVSGVVYGWPSLRLMLVREGVLADRCDAEATAQGSGVCGAQDLALGVAFTVGAWTVQGGRFLGGVLRDATGTRVAAAASAAAAAVGALALALAGPSDAVAVAVGFGLVGMGSSLQLAVQPVAKLFPYNRSLVTGLLSVAFQASGGVLLLLGAIADGRESAHYRRALLGAYASVAAAVALVAAVLLPAGIDFAEVLTEKELDGPAGGAAPAPKATTPPSSRSPSLPPPLPPPPLEGLPFRAQLCSREYIYLTLWFSAVVVAIQYYVVSVGPQLEAVFDAESDDESDDSIDGGGNMSRGQRLTRWYSLCYFLVCPTAGISGWMCDRLGFGPVLLANTSLVAASFLCLSSDRTVVQVLGFIIYCTGRLSIYATFFAHLNSRVGFEYYGTLAGLALLVSSLCALSIYPLLDWGLARGFGHPNALMGAIAALALPYGARVALTERRERNARLRCAGGDVCCDDDRADSHGVGKVSNVL